MAIFVSAGHNYGNTSVREDPGAVSNGYKENQLNVDFRDRVVKEINRRGHNVIVDSNYETLSQYLKRIKTGSGSVVVEYHFDAASSSATGTTVLISNSYTKNSKLMAQELVDSTSEILGIRNRGVKTESESARGRLGLMREEGTVALVELGFITNKSDVDLYLRNRDILAAKHAEIIIKYENLLN